MIDFDQARRLLLEAVHPLAHETVDLTSALNRVAAERVVADADAVPFARSAMDGYAVRAVECTRATQESPIELPVAGRIYAEQGEQTLKPGTALEIMTGAPLPSGADAVIPYEKTERNEDAVRIFAQVAAGSSVFPPGEDILSGEELLRAGDAIRPGILALLAFAGKTKVRVFKRVRAGICAREMNSWTLPQRRAMGRFATVMRSAFPH